MHARRLIHRGGDTLRDAWRIYVRIALRPTSILMFCAGLTKSWRGTNKTESDRIQWRLWGQREKVMAERIDSKVENSSTCMSLSSIENRSVIFGVGNTEHSFGRTLPGFLNVRVRQQPSGASHSLFLLLQSPVSLHTVAHRSDFLVADRPPWSRSAIDVAWHRLLHDLRDGGL